MEKVPATKELLKAHGLKTTVQRVAVYAAMRQLGHASADAVAARLKVIAPTVTLATVYNVLESFVEAGMVSRRFSSNSKMYYDITTSPHCHLYDEDTDTMVDYKDTGLVKIVEEYVRTHRPEGFAFSGVDIQIIGHKDTDK